MTTVRIYDKDRDWLMKVKDDTKLRSAEAVFERIIKLIKKHRMEGEI